MDRLSYFDPIFIEMAEASINYKEQYEALYIEHINLRHELDQLKRLV